MGIKQSEIQLLAGDGKGGMGRETRSRRTGAQATQTSKSGPATGGPRVFVELLPWGPGEPLASLSHPLRGEVTPSGRPLCQDLLCGRAALKARLRVRPDFGGSEQSDNGHTGLG